MPSLQKYSSQIQGGLPANVRASPASFGGETAGLQATARASQRISDSLGEAGNAIQRVEEKRRLRIDTINLVRSTEGFYNEAFDEFNRVQSEEDLVNPATADAYNQKIREKADEYLNNFTGSPDAKARLEAQILNHVGNFSRQMTSNALGAQRKFIMNSAGDRINALAQQVRSDPSSINTAFNGIDSLIDELAPGLYPEDEMSLVTAAQETVTLAALESYTDAGQYEEARDLINENPFFMRSLSQDSQKRILKTIQSGIDEKDKVVRDMQNKVSAIRSAAGELGVEVGGAQLFSAITGISNAQTPQAKVEEFAGLTGTTTDQLTPSVIAKIAYGVDLPSATDTDFNKDFTPTSDLTPKGIGAKIKPAFDSAAEIKFKGDQIDNAIALFKQNGNTQALLSAMISFQKVLDDGAVVREGDIVLQRSTQSLSGQIEGVIKRIDSGQVVGTDLVNQMQVTSKDFVQTALKNYKGIIDPYIDEANRLGYRDVSYGLPKQSYQNVFGGIIDTKPKENVPLSIRNNNPGNLRPPGERTGMKRYETPQEGMLALKEDLASKINGTSSAMKSALGDDYEPTVENLISVYAPNEENDTAGYIKFVSSKLGVAPDYALQPQDIDRLIPAIVEFEGGKDAVDYFKPENKKRTFRLDLSGKVIGSN